MAGSSLLTLLDDIATLLDDIALMTKVAAKKTAGVLGDDLALNAEQVSGLRAERELPVVWAVARGSLRNKVILVPAALAISALAPWAVTPLLMLGGAFLCFEGCEKLLHVRGVEGGGHGEKVKALSAPDLDLVAFERAKISGAVRTDFILSAEIIVIALGTVQGAPLVSQVAVLSGVAALMTIAVYGLVAAIVKLDDAGLYLVRTAAADAWGGCRRASGRLLLRLAPLLMKGLTVVGTAAMFMVGGSILLHGLPAAHGLLHYAVEAVRGVPGIGGALAALAPTAINALAGIVAGGVALTGVGAARGLAARLRKVA